MADDPGTLVGVGVTVTEAREVVEDYTSMGLVASAASIRLLAPRPRAPKDSHLRRCACRSTVAGVGASPSNARQRSCAGHGAISPVIN
jgi:hypothetical protein